MKNYLGVCLSLFVILGNTPVFGVETIQQNSQFQIVQTTSRPYYFKYYKIEQTNDENLYNMTFLPLSKKDEKTLTKSKSLEYKNIKKIEKYLSKNKLDKAYRKDFKYIPTLLKYYQYYNKKCANTDAINYLEAIKQNDTSNEFNKDLLDYRIGVLYYNNNEYQKALYKLVPIIQKKPDADSIRVTISDCYYKIGDYNNAIIEANKVNKNDIESYKIALLNKYLAYTKLNKNNDANKIAYELFSYSYPSKGQASRYIAESTNDSNTKYKFYNIAKNDTSDENEIWQLNTIIAKLEQEKLEIICKKSIQGFFKAPNWLTIAKADETLMTKSVSNERFNDFYNEIHTCTAEYSGNNLKNCLNHINLEQEKITKRLILEQQEKNRQLAEKKRLEELQRMNRNLEIKNQLQQEEIDALRRPKYTNTHLTPMGDGSYYIDSFTY